MTPEGQAHRDAVAAFGVERKEYEAAGLASGTAPYDLRTLALKQGGSGYPRDRADWTGFTVKTPEERGVPKFSGTLEENARTVRAAMALYGLHAIGFLEIGEKFEKMSYAIAQRYEDTPEPYTDGRINVIPNSCKWAIVAEVRKEEEISRRWGKWSGRPFGYSISTILHQRAQMFVKALGYHCLKVSVPSVPFNVMSGIAELSRTNHNIAPDIGARLCSTAVFATDLPLPPTKPIDAGIFRFCASCKKCATYCNEFATGNLPLATEPTWETTGPWNQQGIKVYHNNWVREGGCGLCTQVCPFNHKDLASIHDVTRAIIAITPVFNGFFATMDDVFGYGEEQSMEEWWDRDLRTYPYDVVQSGDNR